MPLSSPLYAGLFGDAETASLLSDQAELAAMIEVERALARVQGRLGLIPKEAAAAIDARLAGFMVDVERLAPEIASAGVAVPALVAALRAAVGPEGADHLHFGATSQDIADTGLMIRLKRALALFDGRLAVLLKRLAGQAKTHRATPMAARTRSQMATPVSYGLRLATVARDLALERRRLKTIAASGLWVQLGGAAGDLSAMTVGGGSGPQLTEELARELGLAAAAPWMTGRRPLLDIATLMVALTNALGKLGADILIGARTEIGEIGLAEAGGSSTMPQKKNPVKAEVLIALARVNAGLLGTFAATGVQAEERDGAAWMCEWLMLPQIIAATGAALLRAEELTAGLAPDVTRMKQAIDGSNGLLLAEAASFALMEHMARAEAQALVKTAAEAARDSGRHLFDEIRILTQAKVDWEGLRARAETVDAAAEMTDRLLEEVWPLIAETA